MHAKSHSKQFRVGSQLAKAVKELGYRREVGYETFLYPNESDSRNLIRWLVSEKLPQNKGNKRLKSKKKGKRRKSHDSVGTDTDEGTDMDAMEDEMDLDDEEEEDMFQSNLTGRALLEKSIHENLKTWMNEKYTILRPPKHTILFRTINIDFPNQLQHGLFCSLFCILFCFVLIILALV